MGALCCKENNGRKQDVGYYCCYCFYVTPKHNNKHKSITKATTNNLLTIKKK